MASAYPGEKNPVSHQKLTYDIMAAGVEVIVNLMEEEELKTFTPYKETMQEHVKACRIMKFNVSLHFYVVFISKSSN